MWILTSYSLNDALPCSVVKKSISVFQRCSSKVLGEAHYSDFLLVLFFAFSQLESLMLLFCKMGWFMKFSQSGCLPHSEAQPCFQNHILL